MFTIAFRDGTHNEKECGGTPIFNEEYLRDPYKRIHIRSKIGQTFMDFVSMSGDIHNSGHPYLALDEESAENISADSWFMTQLRKFMDLGIENEAFFTVPSLMYNKEFLLELRKSWQDIANKHLAPEHQIDCRSLEEQGIILLFNKTAY